MRKPIFGVCDQVRLKPACSATETSYSLEILYSERYGIILQAASNKGADQTVWMWPGKTQTGLLSYRD